MRHLLLLSVYFLTNVLFIPTAAHAANGRPSGAKMPDSWDAIWQPLDFAVPDLSSEEIIENARNYSFVWSAMPWQVEDFQNTNPNMSVGRYMPAFLDDHNARPDPVPEGWDSPEMRARTLQWWNFEADGVGHPDWVLYKCDGVTPAYWEWLEGYTAPNMPLDLTNPSLVEWQLRNMGISDDSEPFSPALSVDLVYLRNFDAACGIYRDGQWVQLFTGEEEDEAYAAAVINWARQIREALHNLPRPRSIFANFPPFSFYSDQEIASLTANLDGVWDEQGFTGFGTGRRYMSGEYWLHKVRNIVAIQQQGGAFFSQNYVQAYPPNLEELEWILSSFLMAKEHSAYVMVTTEAGIRWPYLPELDQNIGHPCSPMHVEQDIYVRDYSRGLVIVNPSWTSSYLFGLPDGSFIDLQGVPVPESVLFLAPATGKVLLTEETRCP